jgi:short-subunit dehydrogenase involved in D-alanine esterification of teichoic acids
MNLSHHTVLITGGASGIGLSLAAQFLQKGSTVIICGRNKDKLAKAKAAYPQLTTYVCDVANVDERISMVKWVSREFPKLNILVNNAGIQKRVLLTQEPAWDTLNEEITINLVGRVIRERLMSQQIGLFEPIEVTEHPSLANVYEQIRQVYLSYPYPWVIGYSGGKDSTPTL